MLPCLNSLNDYRFLMTYCFTNESERQNQIKNITSSFKKVCALSTDCGCNCLNANQLNSFIDEVG